MADWPWWLLLFCVVTGFVLRPYDSTGESWVGYWWRELSAAIAQEQRG